MLLDSENCVKICDFGISGISNCAKPICVNNKEVNKIKKEFFTFDFKQY